MKKSAFLFLMIICLLFASCAQNEARTSRSAEEICESVLEKVKFYETLEPIDSSMIPLLVGEKVNEGTAKVLMYSGSRACADTLIVIELGSADSEVIRGLLESYVKKQRVNFEDYKPDEMNKIENAVISVTNDRAVLVITDDFQTASEAIK